MDEKFKSFTPSASGGFWPRQSSSRGSRASSLRQNCLSSSTSKTYSRYSSEYKELSMTPLHPTDGNPWWRWIHCRGSYDRIHTVETGRRRVPRPATWRGAGPVSVKRCGDSAAAAKSAEAAAVPFFLLESFGNGGFIMFIICLLYFSIPF